MGIERIRCQCPIDSCWRHTSELVYNTIEICRYVRNFFALVVARDMYHRSIWTRFLTNFSFLIRSSSKTKSDPDTVSKPLMVRIWVSLLALGYSQEYPTLANTGQEQLLISPSYNDANDFDKNLLSWMSGPNPLSSEELFNLIPSFPTDILNPNFMQNLAVCYRPSLLILLTCIVSQFELRIDPVVSFVSFLFICRFQFARQAGATDPCIVPFMTTDTLALCQALQDNGLQTLLDSIPIPVTMCHSPGKSVFLCGLLLFGENSRHDVDIHSPSNVISFLLMLPHPIQMTK